MPLAPLVASLLLTQADPAALPDAEALLDRREATLGTPAARAAVKGVVVTGRIEMPEMDAGGEFEELHVPDPAGGKERVRIAIRMEGWGESTQGTDGVVSWSTDPGFGVMIREGVETGELRRAWAAQRSEPWRAHYTTARTVAAVEREGRALVELAMTPKDGGKGERWLVDPATAELVRIAVEYPGPTGQALPMRIVFADWKAVDGVLYPHRLTQEVMGGGPNTSVADAEPTMRIVTIRESIRHETLDPTRVAPPPDVVAAIADPSKRAQRPSEVDPNECKVETIQAQPVATVRVEIDEAKVSETLAVLFGEIGRTVSAQGSEMIGPPFSRYHSIANGRIDLEAGVPVKKAIEASGRVKPSELPAGRVAMTWHVGAYGDLPKSYDRLGAWMKAQSLEARGGFWEVYWTDPGLEPDPSTWRTQILWPVR